MENLNRNLPPQFKTIEHVDIPKSKKEILSNEIPVHIISGGSQDVVKIELIFNAGLWYQKYPLIAGICNSMLNEGTENYTASELAEKFDFYGAYISYSNSQHYASISLYTLNKYLAETLNLLEEIIKRPTFPQKELKTILSNKKQNYLVNREQASALAKEKFNSLIYGENHPYANIFEAKSFDEVKLDDVKSFYKECYTSDNCRIIVAGKINESVLNMIEDCFGAKSWNTKTSIKDVEHQFISSTDKKVFIHKKDAVQSSIRIGRPLFNKTHKDYAGIMLLNLVLGGYFGSRLMQNIREDKGYTYGINSLLLSHLKSGHFAIITEVGTDVCEAAISEIYKEIKRLREELIPEEELNLVKNFFAGEMLRSFDSPFALSESLKGNLPFGYDNSYYETFLQRIKATSSQTIMELANTYFKEEDLYEVVVGEKKA
ncbi:pitrilysin family protein [Ancylomarina sp. 16SWW S1-10-2]|uniref:M16 family metallopeptidase n=1 Tax=Ancylomarina sp. 16SWW S1-10-2 TaxID=2499681 RepID=UPI0012AE1A21|nr:pitrilysin family protein [Ancylomarina sp. 16SWW S1-10-2]MRT91814.1 insulinase family protein [Ancylomarina sp. 16SWW S1-10-2]